MGSTTPPRRVRTATGPSVLRAAIWPALLALAAAPLTGCGSPSGPTAPQSAAKLSRDARWLGRKYHGMLNATTPFTVTRSATTPVPCGKGKAKYSFAGHMRLRIGPVHTYLVTTTVVDAWMRDRGYRIDTAAKPHNSYYRRNSEILVNRKSRTHLTVTASASGERATSELWTLSGHTECLRTG